MIAFAIVLVIIGAVLLAISSPRKGGNLEIGTSDIRTNLPEITGPAKIPAFILGLALIGIGLWMGILLFTKSLEEDNKKVAENSQVTSIPTSPTSIPPQPPTSTQEPPTAVVTPILIPTPSTKPTPTLTEPLINHTPAYKMRETDYLEQSLNEEVPAGSLICLTTGPIVVQNTTESVQFFGNGRATAICWIGSQHAQANNLAGSSLKYVTITSGNAEEIAISLVRQWGKEMTTRSDGCGTSYGPCKAADLAVIRSDGSVIRP